MLIRRGADKGEKPKNKRGRKKVEGQVGIRRGEERDRVVVEVGGI
jgi:hypothetical protein